MGELVTKWHRVWPWVLLLVIGAGAAYFAWKEFGSDRLPDGIAAGNGRIEAVEIDIATKLAGRLDEVLVEEGDFVTRGQIVAQMNTDVLEAQLREAEAQKRESQVNIRTAQSQVAQRQSELTAAMAVVKQREAELEVAKRDRSRAEALAERDAATRQQLDVARATFYGAEATLAAAKAQVAAAEAAVATAESQVIGAESSVDAWQATVERYQADIEDSSLVAPRDGRIQYRVAQSGEVLSAGGTVVNMIDLMDVYMTFFLPTSEAGRLRIGSEARVVLDAAPQYVAPAEVSFVADVAQFTPKTVETAEERQKLMFRVKAHIAPELLREHIQDVKTGLPGMAYVKTHPDAEWPEWLQKRPAD